YQVSPRRRGPSACGMEEPRIAPELSMVRRGWCGPPRILVNSNELSLPGNTAPAVPVYSEPQCGQNRPTSPCVGGSRSVSFCPSVGRYGLWLHLPAGRTWTLATFVCGDSSVLPSSAHGASRREGFLSSRLSSLLGLRSDRARMVLPSLVSRSRDPSSSSPTADRQDSEATSMAESKLP